MSRHWPALLVPPSSLPPPPRLQTPTIKITELQPQPFWTVATKTTLIIFSCTHCYSLPISSITLVCHLLCSLIFGTLTLQITLVSFVAPLTVHPSTNSILTSPQAQTKAQWLSRTLRPCQQPRTRRPRSASARPRGCWLLLRAASRQRFRPPPRLRAMRRLARLIAALMTRASTRARSQSEWFVGRETCSGWRAITNTCCVGTFATSTRSL